MAAPNNTTYKLTTIAYVGNVFVKKNNTNLGIHISAACRRNDTDNYKGAVRVCG